MTTNWAEQTRCGLCGNLYHKDTDHCNLCGARNEGKYYRELQAENERLREALRPFADAWNSYKRHTDLTGSSFVFEDYFAIYRRSFYQQAAKALEGDK